MDRRDTLKTLLVASLAGGVAGSMAIQGCQQSIEPHDSSKDGQDLYGRTPEEIERDKKVSESAFLNEHELLTIATLCDIILPASPSASSATEAGVVDFIDFIVKDIKQHQVPLRGGLMWLDGESNRRFEKQFINCSNELQIQIVDDLAYPDQAEERLEYGVKFFSLMRDLTMTGYYTSRAGFKDLGYKGNVPNVWDGVPEEVLQKHGLKYDQEWLDKCIDQSTRNDIAVWDDEGNLLN